MEELSIFDYLAVLRLRKRIFLTTTLLLLVASFLLVMNWSNYRSIATVEVRESDIPQSIMALSGTSRDEMMNAVADLRISRIQQKVSTTASLIDIITKFNLYPTQRLSQPISEVAKQMRDKIKVQLVSTMLANPATAQKISAEDLAAIAFTISFDYRDPSMAQQVTNELVSRFIEEDLKQRRSQTEETSAFLASQLETLEQSMVEQEKKIADFRQQSGDTRPEALLFNQQIAATLTQNLQSIEAQIAANDGSIKAYYAQLASLDPYSRTLADGQILTSPSLQLKSLQTQYATLSAQYGPSHPDVIRTAKQIEALKGNVDKPADATDLKIKIQDVRVRLATAQKTYGPQNPEVQSLRRQLQNLESMAVQQSDVMNDGNPIKTDADNPAYLQVVSQLRSAEGYRKGLLAEHDSLLRQQEKYRSAVISNPQAEQELAALTRDYDNAQIRYRELKAKKMTAEMNEQMEQDRKGERMEIINPPDYPIKTQPTRTLLFIGLALLSVMSGILSVIIAQLVSQSVMGPSHLTALTGVPALVNVPFILTQDEQRIAEKRKKVVLVLGTSFILIGFALYITFVMPIDVFISVLLQHLSLS